MRAARNTETEVVSQNRSDLSVQCSRSFFFLARCDMVDMLGRWGSDRHPPLCARRGPGRGTPRQHLPPSLVGGADRKGREPLHRGCRNKSCSYGICPPQRKYWWGVGVRCNISGGWRVSLAYHFSAEVLADAKSAAFCLLPCKDTSRLVECNCSSSMRP